MKTDALPRRSFLGLSVFVGGAAVLGAVSRVAREMVRAQNDAARGRGLHPYLHNRPENAIYSVCLQCHTSCPIKCKVVDGVLVKIDGNPYSPQTLFPNVPYADPPEAAARREGKICPKGQSGIETLYDPYRLRTVLKRKPCTPRGGGEWVSIPFEQAVEEIVNGGDLFGEGVVPGLKDSYALRDRSVARAMADDVGKLRRKEMTVEEFKAKHRAQLDVLIDPDHPGLGPKNNLFVFDAGRIQHGRKELMKWFTHQCFGSVNAFEHTTICEQSHHIAYLEMTNQWKDGTWTGGKTHMKPDFLHARFVIFFGTGFSDANFGPPLISGLVSKAVVEHGLRIAVVNPLLSRSAGKADWWIPIRPGGDGAFAMGMIRWIMDHGRYDARYLRNANRAAADADGEPSWTTAAWLVRIEDGRAMRYVRGRDAGLQPADGFVVLSGGRPVVFDPNDTAVPVEGDLEGEYHGDGWSAKPAFALWADRARERTLREYAEYCGVDEETIVEMAREFTSHGKRAVAEFYRGPVQHTDGFHQAQAIIMLNLLVGNPGWKGGLAVGGGHWHEFGGKPGNVWDFGRLHPDPFPAFGVPVTKERCRYEESTLFTGYPAQRPWYPLSENVYQVVIPAAGDGYPYRIGCLFLHKGTPAISCPGGHAQIEILRDPKKIPLFVACDIVVGETSMYADYIIPDTAIWERWGTPHVTPAMLAAVSNVRQPVVAPLTEEVEVDGVRMPINMEAFLIAVAKRLGLPGFGRNAFGEGVDFHHQDDFYLKAVANIAMGDKPGDAVPPASEAEMEVFRKARRHLPPGVFDEERWRRAAGAQYWPHVVTVLNRGGRFEDTGEHLERFYVGELQAHPFRGVFLLFPERVAGHRNSITGAWFDALPRVCDGPRHSDGRPVRTSEEFPFQLITYKEIFGGHTRNLPSNLWLRELWPENAVLLNRRDGQRLGLRDGDRVRLESPSNPDGAYDLGNGEVRHVEGTVRLIEGLRPGVVAVSWHFGHWAYGSRDITVDGRVVRGDPSRSRGLVPNPVMMLDGHVRNVCLSDPIGASASFFDTPVRVRPLGRG